MPRKDYYAILELEKNATPDDIKRAYRKMAIKWHPDKNTDNKEEATNRFKEVAEAYEILSDPEKRRHYDSGVDPNEQTANPRGPRTTMHDPFEIFNAFFGGRDPFADFFGEFGSGHSRRQRSNSRPRGFGGFMGFGGSLFGDDDDDFFGGFGNFGSGGSVFMSSMMGNGRGMAGRTVTTTTQIVNGKEVTRKVTQVTNSDGTVHETVEETTRGPRGGLLQSSTSSRTLNPSGRSSTTAPAITAGPDRGSSRPKPMATTTTAKHSEPGPKRNAPTPRSRNQPYGRTSTPSSDSSGASNGKGVARTMSRKS